MISTSTLRKLLTLSILTAVVSLASSNALAQNSRSLNSLYTLDKCNILTQFSKLQFLAFMGSFDTPAAKCLKTKMSKNDTIGALASLLNGTKVQPSQLHSLNTEIQDVFVWYNASLATMPTDYADASNSSVAHFAAGLAVQAWQNDRIESAITLVRVALAQHEISIGRLLTGIEFKGDVEAYTLFRLQIAKSMPKFADNYVDWYETMLHYEQWDSANLACKYVRTSQEPIDLSTTCLARILFYQKKYSEALTGLQIQLKLTPDNPTVLTWAGINAQAIEEWTIAEKYFLEAIQYNKDQNAFLNLYWRLGDCQRAMGKLVAAQRSYKTALTYTTDATYYKELNALIK